MPSKPASILISYTLTGILVYLVMCGLGEIAVWLPLGSGFAGYATRFVDPALGFCPWICEFLRISPFDEESQEAK